LKPSVRIWPRSWLPFLAVNLAKAPEDLLRTFFEVVQLSVQVHDEGEHATMTITLPADQVTKVAGAAERIGDQMNPQGTPEGRAGGVLECAPGAIHAATSPGQKCRELQICGSVEVERRRRGATS
jgi:hypothetical protein